MEVVKISTPLVKKEAISFAYHQRKIIKVKLWLLKAKPSKSKERFEVVRKYTDEDFNLRSYMGWVVNIAEGRLLPTSREGQRKVGM